MFFKKHQLLQEYFSVSIVIDLFFFNLLATEKRTVRKKQHIFSMNRVYTNTNTHIHKHVYIPISILTLIWTSHVWRLTTYDAWPTIHDIYTYIYAGCMRSDVWGRTVWHIMTYKYTYKCTYTYTCPCVHKPGGGVTTSQATIQFLFLSIPRFTFFISTTLYAPRSQQRFICIQEFYTQFFGYSSWSSFFFTLSPISFPFISVIWELCFHSFLFGHLSNLEEAEMDRKETEMDRKGTEIHIRGPCLPF